MNLLGLMQNDRELRLTGVYQGKTLFIQNPYDASSKSFCISEILVNDIKIDVNYNYSAIKVDFSGFDRYAPVNILIKHNENCNPVIINPDAIFFHSMFSFVNFDFNDSTLNWSTRGEEDHSIYLIQMYQQGIWITQDSILSKENFAGSEYQFFPKLEEGANKLRIQYLQSDGKYLYSRELDFHFYPDPVTFRFYKPTSTVFFSRSATYEIFDAGGNLVLTGQGKKADVRILPSGSYVVYFDKKDPGVFTK